MLKGGKIRSAGLAAVALAAASLATTPAPAQTGGGSDGGYGPGQPCNPVVGGGPIYGGLQCCYYPGQGWFWYYDVVGGGFCGGYIYYEPSEDSADRPRERPSGQ